MLLNSLGSAVLALVLVVQAFSAPARNEDFTFRIPPQRIPLNIENQPLSVIASGTISVATRGHDEYILKLELDADLSDLQQNITTILQSQLDKNDPCGDRIAIEHATLVRPVPPVELWFNCIMSVIRASRLSASGWPRSWWEGTV